MHRIQHWLAAEPALITYETIDGQVWVGARCLVCGRFTPWGLAAGEK